MSTMQIRTRSIIPLLIWNISLETSSFEIRHFMLTVQWNSLFVGFWCCRINCVQWAYCCCSCILGLLHWDHASSCVYLLICMQKNHFYVTFVCNLYIFHFLSRLRQIWPMLVCWIWHLNPFIFLKNLISFDEWFYRVCQRTRLSETAVGPVIYVGEVSQDVEISVSIFLSHFESRICLCSIFKNLLVIFSFSNSCQFPSMCFISLWFMN